jgi:SAM-dependent methyltransferase
MSLLSRFRKPPRPWYDPAPSPWTYSLPRSGVGCLICRWSGDAFDGVAHSESANCPQCGSITRDRFLFWSFVARTESRLGSRVWETSPRMGEDYRSAMRSWFQYTCSDYDERHHKGVVRIDLQQVELPDASVDVLLTPHVLEHVPDTGAALAEIRRVLAPGGRMYLQVPVLQGATAPPTEPEFHGDNTPVFWRFGPDLSDRLRDAGFDTVLLCTDEFLDAVREGRTDWDGPTSPEFDVPSVLGGSRVDDLVSIASREQAARMGILPAYQVLTWECIKR